MHVKLIKLHPQLFFFRMENVVDCDLRVFFLFGLE